MKDDAAIEPEYFDIADSAVKGLLMGIGELGRMERRELDQAEKKRIREQSRDDLRNLNLLPTTFITIAPPAVIGLAALQLGAPVLLAWVAWGIGLFFLAWSATVFRRAVSQAFSVPFWAMSFPLAAFSALTLRLAQEGSGAFQAVAMILLALASLVIAALALATVKGLRDGSLLAPEPVAAIVPAAG